MFGKFRQNRKKADALAQENLQLGAFARAVPFEHCGWNADGAQAISPGFAKLFGVDEIKTVDDIQNALPPDDAAALEGVMQRLSTEGRAFELTVRPGAGGKVLRLHGKRGALEAEDTPGKDGEKHEAVFEVLWAQDITQLMEKLSESADALIAAETENQRHLAALDTLPFPVWERDENLDIAWCNRAYAQIVDDSSAGVIAEQKELPSSSMDKKSRAADRRGTRSLAQQAMNAGKPECERRRMVTGGQRRLYDFHEIPISAEDRIIGVGLDVTGEDSLRTEMEQMSASTHEVLEQLGTAVAIFSDDTRLEFYNTAYEQLWGLDGKWLNGKPRFADILDKLREKRKLPEQADFRQFKQAWIDRFTTLMEPFEELRYLPDGRVLRMVIVPRPRGGILLTFEDVTSRLELETSYNTLVAVQRETLDNLLEGLAVFGEDGRLRLCNPRFAELWGLDPETVEGNPHITELVERMKNLFIEAEWPETRKLLIANGLDRSMRKGRLYRTDGTILEFSNLPLPDGNVLNAWFDVTDSVNVENALIEKNRALEEAERLKLDFLANVSYQLRTPLNAMMGFAEILDQQFFGELSDKQTEYTGGIIDAGHKLVTLIDDILDLSTIEAGYLNLSTDKIALGALIDNVVGVTEEWGRKRGVKIRVDAPKSIGSIVADERRIKQILLNLIGNAINFSDEGREITVFAKRLKSEECVLLGVRDEGIGIAADDLERIFSPFERGREGSHQRRSGAGLGLSLVKSIAELHGGRIEIESMEGEGTTVSCYLPFDAAAGQAAEDAPTAEAGE